MKKIIAFLMLVVFVGGISAASNSIVVDSSKRVKHIKGQIDRATSSLARKSPTLTASEIGYFKSVTSSVSYSLNNEITLLKKKRIISVPFSAKLLGSLKKNPVVPGVSSMAEDKKYFASRLKAMNEVAGALAEQLAELSELAGDLQDKLNEQAASPSEDKEDP